MERLTGLFIDHYSAGEKDDLVNTFPLLKRYAEFTDYKDGLNRNKVIKYINVLYSAKSELVSVYRDDLLIRKEEAAKHAGFEKKEMGTVVECLFKLNDERIVKMIIRFLLIQNSRMWTTICSIEQSFYQTSELLMSPIQEGEDKDKYGAAVKQKPLRAEMIEMISQLDGLYDKLFNDNSDLKDKYDKNDELRMHLNPEQVASKLK